MFISRMLSLLAPLLPITVHAHCDTTEGPAVKDGRTALETGNINYALKWIPADGEAELHDVFGKALTVQRSALKPPSWPAAAEASEPTRLSQQGTRRSAPRPWIK